MGYDDVIGLLLLSMQVFLAESAFVHVNAAATRLDLIIESRQAVADIMSSIARRRARSNDQAAFMHRMRAAQQTC